MREPEPFFRETGTGPGVVCLHSNASTSGQWRGLTDLLALKFRVFAPDSYDSGESPQWPSDRVILLRDEVALIEPVIRRAGPRLALVGHSYGATVALIAALAHPRRVRAMALYEPTLFALLDAEMPAPNAADGIRDVVADAVVALDSGNQDAAAERFIDYWTGTGSWKQTPEQRKPSIAASVRNVRRWGYALFTEPTPLAAFRSLDVSKISATWAQLPIPTRSMRSSADFSSETSSHHADLMPCRWCGARPNPSNEGQIPRIAEDISRYCRTSTEPLRPGCRLSVPDFDSGRATSDWDVPPATNEDFHAAAQLEFVTTDARRPEHADVQRRGPARRPIQIPRAFPRCRPRLSPRSPRTVDALDHRSDPRTPDNDAR